MTPEKTYDCIIVGASPGGLQAAIYLARYNRKVLIVDRGGGRTFIARRIENFLTQTSISGKELIERGIAQARSFNAEVIRGTVTNVSKTASLFSAETAAATYAAPFVIAASGGRENLPQIENLGPFFGTGFFTCVDCDGYHATGKKLLVIGDTDSTVRLAFAVSQMYTRDVTLLLYSWEPPEAYKDEFADAGIRLVIGRPRRVVGSKQVEALEMEDGSIIPCERILSDFGFTHNDEYLRSLNLRKDGRGRSFIVNHYFESSLSGLFIVGPLNTGQDQAIIAAGEGAVAAIEINHRLLEL
ncbi:MAG: FAD-dependent pyridine nucleotide-disulfide oxidoreductase [Nitrospirae bacterium]|nr:MAG: FAD-dependent pyridine nucleotide-disulfide oxidoreductase [Nitrospirota bacterium]